MVINMYASLGCHITLLHYYGVSLDLVNNFFFRPASPSIYLRFLICDQQRHPLVVLYSLVISFVLGNTWVRQLLDFSTRILSGSHYDDYNLVDTLPGELFCM